MPNSKPFLCIIDDDADHRQVMSDVLVAENFRVATFCSADEFLKKAKDHEAFDLVISDINMPGSSGFDLCRSLRNSAELVRLPVILLTGQNHDADKALGLEVGADEFIGKPFSPRHLFAKIRSLLEIRNRERQRFRELESYKDINFELGRFVSPNIASRLGGGELGAFLQPHRAEVTVLFVDLRRFTAFSEKAEPEEVLEVLHHYYTAVGTTALKYKGTLSNFAGDGIMVFFNDPEPQPNHREVAVRMALETREVLMAQKKLWEEKHYNIDFGIGLSEGVATIGRIGSAEFSQYTVIGGVSNFASRLSDIATQGQILISHRFLSYLQADAFQTQVLGDTSLKGIEKPVSLYNVMGVMSAQQGTTKQVA